MKTVKSRWFLLSFGITFLVFSICSAIAVFVVNPPVRSEPMNDMAENMANRYLPTREEARTVLLVLCRDDNSPHSFALLGFEPFKGNMPLLFISPQAVITESGKTTAEVYENSGVTGMREQMETYLGIGVESYLCLTDTELTALMDSFGPAEYLLPQKVEFEKLGTKVTMQAGVHRAGGEEAVAVLTYSGFTGGEEQREQVASEILCCWLNEYLPSVNSMDTDSFYRKLTAYGKTDFAYRDMAGTAQALRFLVKLKTEIAMPVNLEKHITEADGKQYFAISGKREMEEIYHARKTA